MISRHSSTHSSPIATAGFGPQTMPCRWAVALRQKEASKAASSDARASGLGIRHKRRIPALPCPGGAEAGSAGCSLRVWVWVVQNRVSTLAALETRARFSAEGPRSRPPTTAREHLSTAWLLPSESSDGRPRSGATEATYFAHRTGFVRLALKHGVRIVPVVSIGGQETALFLGQGEHIARLLHLHRLLRIDVALVQIAPPWGVTVLDIPGRVPLPAKISI
jgi:hypothetical protein